MFEKNLKYVEKALTNFKSKKTFYNKVYKFKRDKKFDLKFKKKTRKKMRNANKTIKNFEICLRL